jgi:rSAM/selenodomain-associated transferase 2
MAESAACSISVIIPCLNEAAIVTRRLADLQILRDLDCELILVDGGSADETRVMALPWVDRLIVSKPGRARQMNAGAQAARGQVLWFLHLDSRLPENAVQLLSQALEQSAWGRFDVRLSGRHPLLRIVERMMNLRSRLSGIATGDQAVFVERRLFFSVGGFPDIPLMEDIALSKRLKRVHAPVSIHQALTTSSRRWEQQGLWRTVLRMWLLRLAYFLGVAPTTLLRWYPPCNTPDPDY